MKSQDRWNTRAPRGLPALHLAAAVMTALLAAACTETNSPASNRTVHGLAVAVGAATEQPDPPDFIKATRTGKTDYMAVGVTPPDRKLQPRKGDDVKKLENELDATLSQHNRLAGRKAPAKPAANATSKPAKKKLPGEDAQ